MRLTSHLPRLVMASMLMCVFGVATLHATDPPKAEKQVKPEDVKPSWEVGQTWLVETKSRVIQSGSPVDNDQYTTPIRWQFKVAQFEKVNGKECYRVEVTRADNSKLGPVTTFWAEKDALTLRKVETQRRIGGNVRTMTQNYEPNGGYSVAVLGLANAIPIDLPSFSSVRLKGPATYTSFSGKEKSRGAGGGANFVTEVKQEIAIADPARVSKLSAEREKGKPAAKAVEMRLKAPGRQVDQIWKQGSPWPAYSDNGMTVSQLISKP